MSDQLLRRWMAVPLAAVLLTACVTINVYFPAAEAEQAAREFVDNVIGDDAPADSGEGAPGDEPADGDPASGEPSKALGWRIDWLALVGIGSAHAQSQPDISLKTPAIQAIQARMSQRFDAQLRAGFDAGALGFAEDGTIVMRDAGKLPLQDRVAVNQAVADDNRDRRAVYREVAVANDHPEWEPRIREVFARQWIASARPGWWYQQDGSWRQK